MFSFIISIYFGVYSSYVCIRAHIVLFMHVRLVMSDSLQPQGSVQASLSMTFSRQEHWSGLPFPSPGDLPDPRDRTWVSCIGRPGSLPLSHLGSPCSIIKTGISKELLCQEELEIIILSIFKISFLCILLMFIGINLKTDH